ncbi:hypothetical protein CV102_01725 [Natronococcus pandeyae]|uniref:Uncharacterized protein n=1 Tax=Natronococcus pandeyae TaxID=2055836 RepID=A0A8J8Q738_9EURY|nr:hypothetical protein [Natronococcus pandeyae]TYL40322.1 hypothetical protein CV102_01725 [Natronococcus pandeyae]
MTTRLGLAITILGLVSLVVATAGASSVALERPVTIDVVDDDEATIGFEPENGTDLVTITNRHGSPVTVFADVRAENRSENGTEVEPGESETIANPACDLETDGGDVPVDVTVVSDSFELERTVTASTDCSADEDGG